MSSKTVRVHRNGKDCFYIVEDLTITKDFLTFHIQSDFYIYEMSLLAYELLPTCYLVDCTKLKLVDIVQDAGGNII